MEEDSRGIVHTNAPDGLLRLFHEAFQIVRIKEIKDLMLKMLKIYEDITFQF